MGVGARGRRWRGMGGRLRGEGGGALDAGFLGGPGVLRRELVVPGRFCLGFVDLVLWILVFFFFFFSFLSLA